jgi:hypothetical protein
LPVRLSVAVTVTLAQRDGPTMATAAERGTKSSAPTVRPARVADCCGELAVSECTVGKVIEVVLRTGTQLRSSEQAEEEELQRDEGTLSFWARVGNLELLWCARACNIFFRST